MKQEIKDNAPEINKAQRMLDGFEAQRQRVVGLLDTHPYNMDLRADLDKLNIDIDYMQEKILKLQNGKTVE